MDDPLLVLLDEEIYSKEESHEEPQNSKEQYHEESQNSKEDQEDNLSMGIQSVVKEGVKIMDMFADTDNTQYQAFKSMLTLWNPESSKWAVHASKNYKKALNARPLK